jgi:threonine dehydrogenase-like Zn-dependent dehydrogenase
MPAALTPRVSGPSADSMRVTAVDMAAGSVTSVAHDVQLPGQELFFSHVHLHGGPAPVRRFLPDLINLIMRGEIDPGRVFDLELPLTEAAEGYRAMDERRAIKTLLHP